METIRKLMRISLITHSFHASVSSDEVKHMFNYFINMIDTISYFVFYLIKIDWIIEGLELKISVMLYTDCFK